MRQKTPRLGGAVKEESSLWPGADGEGLLEGTGPRGVDLARNREDTK